MPESREDALARAKREGFPEENLVKGEKGWYIAPRGITTEAGRSTYANCRDRNDYDIGSCAAIAHKVDTETKEKMKK